MRRYQFLLFSSTLAISLYGFSAQAIFIEASHRASLGLCYGEIKCGGLPLNGFVTVKTYQSVLNDFDPRTGGWFSFTMDKCFNIPIKSKPSPSRLKARR